MVGDILSCIPITSRKFLTVLLNETTRFPFLGSIHLRRFNLLSQKTKRETTEIRCLNKNIGIYKTTWPHSWNRVSDTGFHHEYSVLSFGLSGDTWCKISIVLMEFHDSMIFPSFHVTTHSTVHTHHNFHIHILSYFSSIFQLQHLAMHHALRYKRKTKRVTRLQNRTSISA